MAARESPVAPRQNQNRYNCSTLQTEDLRLPPRQPFQLDPGTGSMTSSSAPDFHLMRLKLYGGDFPCAILKEAENLKLPSFEGQKSAEPPTSQ